MSDQLVVRQLRAVRDLIDNALELLGDVDQPDAGPCTHPKDKRRPAAVMGDPDRFLCLECQTLVGNQPAPAAEA